MSCDASSTACRIDPMDAPKNAGPGPGPSRERRNGRGDRGPRAVHRARPEQPAGEGRRPDAARRGRAIADGCHASFASGNAQDSVPSVPSLVRPLRLAPRSGIRPSACLRDGHRHRRRDRLAAQLTAPLAVHPVERYAPIHGRSRSGTNDALRSHGCRRARRLARSARARRGGELPAPSGAVTAPRSAAIAFHSPGPAESSTRITRLRSRKPASTHRHALLSCVSTCYGNNPKIAPTISP